MNRPHAHHFVYSLPLREGLVSLSRLLKYLIGKSP